MSKYTKLFETQQEYNTYINGDPILPNVSFIEETQGVGYTPAPHDYSQDYLTFRILSGGTIIFYTSNTVFTPTISYSKDNGNTWTNFTAIEYQEGVGIQVNNGDVVMFKGNNPTYCLFSEYGQEPCSLNSDCQFTIEGNIMSLIYGDNFVGQTVLPQQSAWTFYSFFAVNEGLTSAENLVLPATTLTEGCYCCMFMGCTSLTTAPSILPATTLATYCYEDMFTECTSLTTAPELPATTLAENCYGNMFRYCSQLNYIKCLATNISASNCTSNWVSGVSATGTFVKAPSMTGWTTGVNGIPSGWTVVDVN